VHELVTINSDSINARFNYEMLFVYSILFSVSSVHFVPVL